MGSIQLTGPDGTENLLLAGRAQQLASRAGAAGPTVHVTSVRGKAPSIKVDVRVQDARKRAVLADGQSVEVGGYVLHYTSARTRMIELIESHSPGPADKS